MTVQWRPHDPCIDNLPDIIPEDVMAVIGGRPFRCDCGGNVFRHPRGAPLVFVCNSCDARWRGDR